MEIEVNTLTRQYIVENAEYTLNPAHGHWRAWILENIVLVAVSGIWPPKHWAQYFGFFWIIFCERKKSWDRVYFTFDTSKLPVQTEGFRSYIKENWVHLLEREDYCLSIIEPNALKRTIWKSIYRLINIESKIHLFKDHLSTLRWILKDRLKSKEKAENPDNKTSIPEKLNLKWIGEHAHLHLVGRDRLWIITACQNIILLKIQNHWTPDDVKEHMILTSGLPSLILENWNRIFFIFDVTLMDFAIKDGPRFLKSDWLRFLDRDDIITCVVHKNKFNRFLWRQLLRQIGKLNKVKLFPDCNTALAWIHNEKITQSSDLNGTSTMRCSRSR